VSEIALFLRDEFAIAVFDIWLSAIAFTHSTQP
jgi:hypothetical protein